MDIFSKEMLYANGGWVRPNLTANGTLGGNSFAVAWSAGNASSKATAYKAVDNSSSTYTQFSDNGYFTFYNPTQLKVTKLNFDFLSSNHALAINSSTFTVQGSNNGSSWTSISISQYPASRTTPTSAILNNNNYYKNYRLLLTPYSGQIAITDLQITAEEQ